MSWVRVPPPSPHATRVSGVVGLRAWLKTRRSRFDPEGTHRNVRRARVGLRRRRTGESASPRATTASLRLRPSCPTRACRQARVRTPTGHLARTTRPVTRVRTCPRRACPDRRARPPTRAGERPSASARGAIEPGRSTAVSPTAGWCGLRRARGCARSLRHARIERTGPSSSWKDTGLAHRKRGFESLSLHHRPSARAHRRMRARALDRSPHQRGHRPTGRYWRRKPGMRVRFPLTPPSFARPCVAAAMGPHTPPAQQHRRHAGSFARERVLRPAAAHRGHRPMGRHQHGMLGMRVRSPLAPSLPNTRSRESTRRAAREYERAGSLDSRALG